MNRIDKRFQQLRKAGQKAFIAFVTCGFPDLATTERLVAEFERIGVDLVELGVPFSDPLADGPVIQASSQQALSRGVTVDKIFRTVSRIRQRCEIPLALMTYYNPVMRFGEERFIRSARQSGVDGLIVPDLPWEEGRCLRHLARKKDLAVVGFLSPTTTLPRMRRIVAASTGFIYFVSMTGVTGTAGECGGEALKKIKLAKTLTSRPVCVGFGISRVEQVRSIAAVADGVIVGSAIVKELEGPGPLAQRCGRAVKLVESLKRGLTSLPKEQR